MKRFRFSLEKLLDLRRARQSEIEIRYGRAMGAVAEVERRIADMNKAREDHKSMLAALAPAGGRVVMTEAIAIRQFIDRLWLAMLRAAQERVKAEEAAEVVRLELMEARRGVRALEILRERRQQEWRREADREEVRTLDDIHTGAAAGGQWSAGEDWQDPADAGSTA
jgi:flagellar export protein FliJ